MSATGTIGTAINETRSSLATVFRNRSLRRLNLALAGSMIGDWAYYTALVIWAYGVGGATAVGIFGTVKMAASAVAAPFTSALADRMPRRTLMVLCDVVRAVLVAAAAALVEWDGPDLAVFGIAVVAGLVGTAFRPAQLALTPSLVDEPDELTAANGVGSTIESLAFFVGPALAGLLLGVTDVAVVFLLNAATFVWSAVLVAGVHPRASSVVEAPRPDEDADAPADPDGGFVRSALAGFGVIWRHPDLRLITVIYAAQTVVAGASLVFGVAIALDLTDLGPAGLGYLDSTLGVGALVGGLLTVALATRHRLASDFGWGVFFWAVPLLLVAVWPIAAAAFVAMAIIGAANPVVDVNANTILQRLAPDAVLGRVFGALESALIATMALGSLVMPLLISWIGLRWGLVALSVPIAAIALVSMPRLRRLDASVSEPEGVALLYGVPLFQPLRRPMVEQLAATMEQREVRAGDVVVREGDVGDLFYVIENGSLDATHDGRLLTQHGGRRPLRRDRPAARRPAHRHGGRDRGQRAADDPARGLPGRPDRRRGAARSHGVGRGPPPGQHVTSAVRTGVRRALAGRLLALAAALVVAVGLVAQVVATAGKDSGYFDSDASRVANVFAYFTVQSNILVLVTCAALALRPLRPRATWFWVLRLDGVLCIAVTFVVFHVALADLQDLEGLDELADFLLHTASPVLCVAGWLVSGPRRRVDWEVVRLSLVFPVLWLVFTLVRGPLVGGWYPYPFLDVDELGYPRVLLNAVLVSALFLALAAGARWADRRLPGGR